MTSASTGWALRSTVSPWSTEGGYLATARTSDGARTWTDVTPPAAVALLETPDATAVLDALGPDRAWLAVTAAGTHSSSPLLTVVFGTSDGGRTWTGSVPFKVPAPASLLGFADPDDGWLLASYGGTMGQDQVGLYRMTDAGRRWSLVAATPPSGTGGNGLPAECDKAGLVFAAAQAGWLASACNGVAGCAPGHPGRRAVGAAGAASPGQRPLLLRLRGVQPPQFFGRTGFIVIGTGPAHPSSWPAAISARPGSPSRCLRGPAGTRRVTLFGPRDGVLVSAGASGTIGGIFATTADGGTTWTAIPQRRSFAFGTEVDFVSPRTGFAWVPGGDTPAGPPVMAKTTDSGLTWTSFTPVPAVTSEASVLAACPVRWFAHSSGPKARVRPGQGRSCRRTRGCTAGARTTRRVGGGGTLAG